MQAHVPDHLNSSRGLIHPTPIVGLGSWPASLQACDWLLNATDTQCMTFTMPNDTRYVPGLGQKTCGRKSVPQDVTLRTHSLKGAFASLSLLDGMPVFKRVTLLISRRVALKHGSLVM